MITIIDYKTGNLGSIQNILKKIRAESLITSSPEEIAEASKIILPGVGAFDQRRAHLSSLITSGQITRDEALRFAQENPYTESEINDDIEYVAKKLDWTLQEFRNIIALPPRRHKDFANKDFLFSFSTKTKRMLKKIFE